jgi:recombination associated protein RdgC
MADAHSLWYCCAMPALRGPLTYARFFVEGELPNDFSDRFMRSIRQRAMKPLLPEDEDLERSGWCTLGEPMELDMTHESVFYNEYINLGFRTDRWSIPSPMLKAKVKEAESLYLSRKGKERLSRTEKKELKELVSKKLRKQLSPAMSVIDFSWAINDGIVRFFSLSPRKGALMMELFQRTFSLSLVPESPYILACRVSPSQHLSKQAELAWEELEPTLLGHGDL